MKIYRLEKGIVLVGKAWEIRTKLKEYSCLYQTVHEWVTDETSCKQKQTTQNSRISAIKTEKSE